MSHLISYKWIRKTKVIPELGLNYNMWGFYLVVFLVGVRFSGGLLFYSSVPQFYFDIFSYNILFSPPSVPQFYFEDISYNILFSPLSVPQSYFDDISYYILLSSLFSPPSVPQSLSLIHISEPTRPY